MERELVGNLKDGRKLEMYTLEYKQQKVQCLNYGARLYAWYVPHPEAKNTCLNLVLNRDNLADYENDPAYMGAIVGPIPNRLDSATAYIAGQSYKLVANEAEKALHSSTSGFSNYCFDLHNYGSNFIELKYDIADMSDKLPGNRKLIIRYELLELNDTLSLACTYRQISDKTTACNVTNHSYFKLWDQQILNANNLTGESALAKVQVKLPALFYTPTDENMLVTGAIKSCANSIFDFTEAKTFEAGLKALADLPVRGYDHNFILERNLQDYAADSRTYYSKSAEFVAPFSKVKLSIKTTEVGAQIYTANYLDTALDSAKESFKPHTAFCFETQAIPNSFKFGHIPTIIQQAQDEYISHTEFSYSLLTR